MKRIVKGQKAVWVSGTGLVRDAGVAGIDAYEGYVTSAGVVQETTGR